MLWTAFTLTGMRMSLLLKKRQMLLEDTLTFLNTLIVSIEYSRTSIVKIICDISGEDTVKNLNFIRICANELNEGLDFPIAWNNAVGTALLYKSDERTKLLQLGNFLGTSDSENQINIIESYISYFKRFLNTATDDYNKYGKISSLFGMFVGAAVFILLF